MRSSIKRTVFENQFSLTSLLLQCCIVGITICLPDFPFRIRTVSFSQLWREVPADGLAVLPAPELPWLEGYETPLQRQPSSNGRVQSLILFTLCFILRHFWMSQNLPPWGICWTFVAAVLDFWSTQSCVLMVSVMVLKALYASQRFLPHILLKKGTTSKYENKLSVLLVIYT